MPAARRPLVVTPRSAASARPGFVSRSFTASLIGQALAHVHGCGPQHYDRLEHLTCARIGGFSRTASLFSRVDAFHQPQLFARANGRVGSTLETPLVTYANTTLHQVRQSVNGSFLASKDRLTLKSGSAPCEHDVAWRVCSYTHIRSGGLLFPSRSGLFLDSASAKRTNITREDGSPVPRPRRCSRSRRRAS